MPRKGKPRVTDQQRSIIASGAVAGKTRAEIATATGLAMSTVQHQLADPRTETLIARLKRQSEPKIQQMWNDTLDRIADDIKAKDHVVSATARGQLLRIIPLGDPPLTRITPPDNVGGDFTLEELLITFRRISIRGAGDASAIRK